MFFFAADLFGSGVGYLNTYLTGDCIGMEYKLLNALTFRIWKSIASLYPPRITGTVEKVTIKVEFWNEADQEIE